MPFSYRKRVKLGRGLFGNISGNGASISRRKGRVTVSSRGRFSVRLLRGLSWRGKV